VKINKHVIIIIKKSMKNEQIFFEEAEILIIKVKKWISM